MDRAIALFRAQSVEILHVGAVRDPRREGVNPSDRTQDLHLVKATRAAAARRCDQHDREGDHRADGESDH